MSAFTCVACHCSVKQGVVTVSISEAFVGSAVPHLQVHLSHTMTIQQNIAPLHSTILMHCVLRTSARAVESWPCAAAYINGVRPLEIASPLNTSLTEDNPSSRVTCRAFLFLTFTYCPRRWGQHHLQQAGPQQRLLPVQPDYSGEQVQLVYLINISCTDHASYNTWRISIVSPFSASCCSCLAAL